MQTQRNVVYERDETRFPRLSGMNLQVEDALSIVKLRKKGTR